MKFEEMTLSQELLKAIDQLEYKTVLPVQEKVIPILLERKDVVVQSKTGSGKTASYAIPEIEKIDWNLSTPQVLVITPTRELAKQVQNEFKMIGSYKKIQAIPLIGQQPIKGQIMLLKSKVHVVCGTIGRILDHIERGTLDVSLIHTCIIDEADECFKLGFLEDLTEIMKHLPQCTKALFSATYPSEIQEVIHTYLQDPISIKIKDTKEYNTDITLHAVSVTKENKMDILFSLINQDLPKQAIIFCNFRENVEEVFDAFYEKGYSCCMIHGGLEQDERLENMRDFKKGMFRFLIASDIAARGIDVERISHVYNFDLPTTTETLIHRIGRSGRVRRQGESTTLVLNTQMKYIERMEEELDTAFDWIEKVVSTPMQEILKTSEPQILKEEKLQSTITRLYIKGGKNKKIRAKDLVGAILQNPNICFEDIGVIEIMEYQSYVEILNGKGKLVFEDLKTRTIKNKKILVEIAKD